MGQVVEKTAFDLAVRRGEIHDYFHVLKVLLESGAYANGYHLFVAVAAWEAVKLFPAGRSRQELGP